MTAKEYLSQVEKIKIQIRWIEDEIEELRESAASAGSPGFEQPAGRSESSRVEAAVLRIQKKEDELLHKKAVLAEQKARIFEEITRVEDNRYVSVLILRYLEGKKLVDIAEEMGYAYPHLCTLHGEALKAFAVAHNRDHLIES